MWIIAPVIPSLFTPAEQRLNVLPGLWYSR